VTSASLFVSWKCKHSGLLCLRFQSMSTQHVDGDEEMTDIMHAHLPYTTTTSQVVITDEPIAFAVTPIIV